MQQEADGVTRPQVRILPAPPLWYFIKIIIFAVADILYLLPHALESELSRWQTRLENDGLGETSGVRILRSPPYRLLQQNLIKENGINIFIR